MSQGRRQLSALTGKTFSLVSHSPIFQRRVRVRMATDQILITYRESNRRTIEPLFWVLEIAAQ